MLNRVILKRLTRPEIRVIYESKVRVSDMSIKTQVRSAVKELRFKFTATIKDPLAQKLLMYGNRGGWYKEKLKVVAEEHARRKLLPRAAQVGKA